MTKVSKCGGSSKPAGNGSPARMYFPPVTRWTESFMSRFPGNPPPLRADSERTASKPIASLRVPALMTTTFVFFALATCY